MATIYNAEYVKKAVRFLKLAQSKEEIPTQIADKVVLTYSLDFPYVIQFKLGAATNATSATILTTSLVSDTYIVAAQISTIRDATATSTGASIEVTPYESGSKTAIISLAALTLNAQSESSSMVFPIPLKVARGTTITVTNSTNVANIQTRGCIHFFEVPD